VAISSLCYITMRLLQSLPFFAKTSSFSMIMVNPAPLNPFLTVLGTLGVAELAFWGRHRCCFQRSGKGTLFYIEI